MSGGVDAALPADWLVPDWPAPAVVQSLCTTRAGGVSQGPYASMNLGLIWAKKQQQYINNIDIKWFLFFKTFRNIYTLPY